jgi:membrane protease YdiL (CAAX protease family)
MKKILLIICGYFLIYGALESAVFITGGDTVKTENALIVALSTVSFALAVEMFIFKNKFSKSLVKLGFGKPGFKAIFSAILISILLFCCYPLITLITGYKFILPDKWLWLAIGVFALHGIAEETLSRGFLFHQLREGRSFIKAVVFTIPFFAVAHIPIILTQGIIVGGTAMLLAITSSFPFAYLFEKGNNTIWAPAIIHSAVDTVIPMLAYDTSTDTNRQAAIVLWMISSIVIPYFAFGFLKKKNSN